LKIKKVIHSNRRTIALQVCDDTSLIIRAPFYTSNQTISEVILKHNKWLENKKKEIMIRNLKYPMKKFVNGELFFFLGNNYPLVLVKEQREQLSLSEGKFLLRENLNHPEDAFITWYKKMANKTVTQQVEVLAGKYKFEYNKISITHARKQWGSCSHSGNLNFSWRLMMTPLMVINYIIIHELVHLEIKNHSKNFWNKVEKYMPSYKTQKEWLKKNGHSLKL